MAFVKWPGFFLMFSATLQDELSLLMVGQKKNRTHIDGRFTSRPGNNIKEQHDDQRR